MIFSQQKTSSKSIFDQLKIDVNPLQNRELSFTDKKSGYFYTSTHSDNNQAWHTGWNINGNRILSDYQIFINDKIVKRNSSQVVVFPHLIERKYPNASEKLSLLDNMEALIVEINTSKNSKIDLKLLQTLIDFKAKTSDGIFYQPKENRNAIVLLTTLSKKNDFYSATSVYSKLQKKSTFLIIYAENKKDVLKKSIYIKAHLNTLLLERKNRIEKILDDHFINSDSKSLNKALPWIGATLDQLVSNQQGKGIYAGLPWFNQYWGRDMFISMPGTCLVSGKFEIAKEILLNFARFQNQDTTSKYYGRIPNRAQSADIIYNTTDGTPLFINQIKAYVDYTGDFSIIPLLYLNIKISLKGSLKNWVDSKGYLTHDDADTWMDAKIKNVIPLSPRGNRANDIQSLWYQQLENTVFFAHFMNDDAVKDTCQKLLKKVKQNFIVDFVDTKNGKITDRISKNEEKDTKNRPNQLYCYELIDNQALKSLITKNIWSTLVYPWGVASLSQLDSDFHPYHEHWHYYHKDEAYHNGTIWLWNNGIAMQRMIETNQKDKAYQLFKNMNRHTLKTGAIGSLSENGDALPLPNKKWIRNTGTFLQAWSNAEQLRVWYQCFLGFKPLLSENKILFQPNIPSELNHLTTRIKIGNGNIDFEYIRNKNLSTYTLKNKGIDAKIQIEISDYQSAIIDLKNSQNIIINTTETKMNVKVFENNRLIKNDYFTKDEQKMDAIKQANLIFKNVDFVKPVLKEDLKCLKKYHKIPLTF